MSVSVEEESSALLNPNNCFAVFPFRAPFGCRGSEMKMHVACQAAGSS